jgi:hypothetical protein
MSAWPGLHARACSPDADVVAPHTAVSAAHVCRGRHHGHVPGRSTRQRDRPALEATTSAWQGFTHGRMSPLSAVPTGPGQGQLRKAQRAQPLAAVSRRAHRGTGSAVTFRLLQSRVTDGSCLPVAPLATCPPRSESAGSAHPASGRRWSRVLGAASILTDRADTLPSPSIDDLEGWAPMVEAAHASLLQRTAPFVTESSLSVIGSSPLNYRSHTPPYSGLDQLVGAAGKHALLERPLLPEEVDELHLSLLQHLGRPAVVRDDPHRESEWRDPRFAGEVLLLLLHEVVVLRLGVLRPVEQHQIAEPMRPALTVLVREVLDPL